MNSYLANFVPDPADLVGLAGLALWSLVFIILGAATAGRDRLMELDLACGFGLACLVFTVLGVATTLPFTYVAYALLVVSVPLAVVAYRREGRFINAGWLKAFVLSAPLILLVADMMPSQWDEFTHWLPNARFLVAHDGFPNIANPNPLSALPAYPYGMPIVAYLTSLVTGAFVENASALFNVVLMAGLALAVAKLVGAATTGDGSRLAPIVGPGNDHATAPSWMLCAIGALAVTALNPTFVAKLVFTAYSDPSTAVLLGLGFFAMLHLLEAAADGDGMRMRRVAWRFGLIAAALVNIRQANLVLFVALIAGMMLAAWRDPRVATGDVVRSMILPLLLPVTVYVSWRLYVAGNFNGGEFQFLPVDQWRLDRTFDVLGRMILIASKKGGYFSVMLVAVALGVRALFRVRGTLDHVAIIAATVFLLYNGFLLVTYLIAFGEYEGLRAASYWRYNTHLGGICVLFAAYGLARLWRARASSRFALRLRWVPIVLILAVPFAFASKIRFDLDPAKLHVRTVGEDLARSLATGDRLAVVDEGHNGEYAVILRYAVSPVAPIAISITSFTRADAPVLRGYIDDHKATHVWVHVPTPKAQEILGVALPQGASHLLTRVPGSGWRVERSWRHEGYRGK